jgi:NADH-quinone oxidoreductase subunit J
MLASPVMLAFQLLIYAGGIMVLLLFAIFLLERRAGPITASNHYVLPAGFTAALLTIVLVGALRLETFRDRSLREPPLEVQVPAGAESQPQWFGYYRVTEPEGGAPAQVLPGQQPSSNVARTGFYFLTYYLLPFELTSLILVVAMVGAILLARREKGWVAAGRLVERPGTATAGTGDREPGTAGTATAGTGDREPEGAQ